jgi:translation initiation factor IF-3
MWRIRVGPVAGESLLEESVIAKRYAQPRREEDRTRINDRIRARQIRVIDEEGEQLGIMAPQDGLRMAEERGLDLVEVAPNADPPVCRLIDYGKYRYQQTKRAKESKKHQHTVTVKEIKYRPKISDHDFEFKTNHVKEFLEAGNKVKITIMFRGREMAHPEFGRHLLERVLEDVKDMIVEEPTAARAPMEGRNMTIMITPSAKKMKAVKETAHAAADDGKETSDAQDEDE